MYYWGRVFNHKYIQFALLSETVGSEQRDSKWQDLTLGPDPKAHWSQREYLWALNKTLGALSQFIANLKYFWRQDTLIQATCWWQEVTVELPLALLSLGKIVWFLKLQNDSHLPSLGHSKIVFCLLIKRGHLICYLCYNYKKPCSGPCHRFQKWILCQKSGAVWGDCIIDTLSSFNQCMEQHWR